ncbi:class I SAM-dependent methyltransferase [Rhodococcus sp. X156]|uniref:class I SAM-dependent methyltransferase n=1 Tax=Rhodococcus sp. X156 TaxID=2499145 RepID=UPI000FDBB7B4|nr:class I SAM-dependent methyltransferase [Rhodococcus sp. X156]
MGYHEWHDRPGYYKDISRHFDPKARLLDVGCGTAWLAEEFSDYVGVDTAEDVVTSAAAKGIDVRLASKDGSLPFADSSFDGVILKDVLEHLPDPVAMVREVRRVLRPGGRVFASSPDAQRWVWNDYTHLRPYTRIAMRRLWADQGMTVEKVSYECVAPGTGIVSGLTRRKQRPVPFVLAAHLPIVRRNVWILATRPGDHAAPSS